MIKEAIGIGETINLAQEQAKMNLGEENKDIKFEVIQVPTKKTLGIFGGKPAKVRAFVESTPGKLAADYVEEVLKEFGLKNFTIEMEEKENAAELHILGKRLSPIIGKRGKLLDDIQYLAGLVANSGEKQYFRLTINAGDYRDRREKTLEELAKKIANRTLKSGVKTVLEPMTPYERRVIHLAIENIDGVKSYSEGEGLERHIIVEKVDG
ncbi:MAG: Jag N-terminal domain-containing protein [Clostridia bacterium]|nr:Jag N-terminal domain-containing protein [Clostridia bacterium]